MACGEHIPHGRGYHKEVVVTVGNIAVLLEEGVEAVITQIDGKASVNLYDVSE